MLNFILGPSGSGKSHTMLAALRARAARGERSILIVPEQFTSSTEGQLYRTLGDSLSAYVESYSFTSLAEALLPLLANGKTSHQMHDTFRELHQLIRCNADEQAADAVLELAK